MEDKVKELRDEVNLNHQDQEKKQENNKLSLEYLDWIFDKEFLRTKK